MRCLLRGNILSFSYYYYNSIVIGALLEERLEVPRGELSVMPCLVLLLTKNSINETIIKVHKYISLPLWHLHSNHADVELNCAQFCICLMLCIGYLHCRTLF